MGRLTQIGGTLALFGVLSIVMYFLGYNLRILLWIDLWGDTIGWIIRIGLVLVGGGLAFFGYSASKSPDEKPED